MFKALYPCKPDGMEYTVQFITGTTNKRFFKDLEEVVSTMEISNEDFSKKTVLTPIVKKPFTKMFLDNGTFGQISAKYGCIAYELKGNEPI